MRAPLSLSPARCLRWFVVANLAFLGGDIALAHLANHFAKPVEWLPVAFSLAAPLVLVPWLLQRGRPARDGDEGTPGSRVGRSGARALGWTALAVGFAAIGVGGLGMVFHLESGFFQRQTLQRLVYSAPFVAPLAYVGVGLLLLLLELESEDSPDFAAWVVLLALGGFVGNLGLSLLDHAQNGFFSALEWIPVVAAAFGTSFLLVLLFRRERSLENATLVVCGLEALVGVAGFVIHVAADLRRPAQSWLERFVLGAPAFAPLLFANLALLAALGIWATRLAAERSGRGGA